MLRGVLVRGRLHELFEVRVRTGSADRFGEVVLLAGKRSLDAVFCGDVLLFLTSGRWLEAILFQVLDLEAFALRFTL